MKKSLPLLIFCFFFFAISVFTQEARKIDEFGDIGCDEWLSRLSNLITEINASPDSKAYIIYYGGRYHPFFYRNGNVRQKLLRRNEAKARVEYFKSFASLKNLGNKVVFLFGGYQEKFKVEFWIVPNTKNPPKLQATIKPENMKFRKGRVTKKELDELCRF